MSAAQPVAIASHQPSCKKERAAHTFLLRRGLLGEPGAVSLELSGRRGWFLAAQVPRPGDGVFIRRALHRHSHSSRTTPAGAPARMKVHGWRSSSFHAHQLQAPCSFSLSGAQYVDCRGILRQQLQQERFVLIAGLSVVTLQALQAPQHGGGSDSASFAQLTSFRVTEPQGHFPEVDSFEILPRMPFLS